MQKNSTFMQLTSLKEVQYNSFVSNFYVFIYLFLAVLGLCCCVGFSLVASSEGYSPVVVCECLTVVASLVVELGLQTHGGQQLQCTGLVACEILAPQSEIKPTSLYCRQILNHSTTRETPRIELLKCRILIATSFQRTECENSKEKGNFTLEKPDNLYIIQVIKTNISTDKSH